MRQLIINADDFGLHPTINAGIIEGHQKGVITSTSLIAAGISFDDAVTQALQNPDLGIGVHLALVGGLPPIAPADKVASLLTKEGLLYPHYPSFIAAWLKGKIALTDIVYEWNAQITKILDAGITVSHFDSHQHLHVLPGLNQLMIHLSEQFSIFKIRIPKEPLTFFATGPFAASRIIARTGLTTCAQLAESKWKTKLTNTDHFYGTLAGGNLTKTRWKNIIQELPLGTSEVMTHPGLNSSELERSFPWNYHWEEELEALKSEELRTWIHEKNIRLINYHHLPNRKD